MIHINAINGIFLHEAVECTLWYCVNIVHTRKLIFLFSKFSVRVFCMWELNMLIPFLYAF